MNRRSFVTSLIVAPLAASLGLSAPKSKHSIVLKGPALPPLAEYNYYLKKRGDILRRVHLEAIQHGNVKAAKLWMALESETRK